MIDSDTPLRHGKPEAAGETLAKVREIWLDWSDNHIHADEAKGRLERIFYPARTTKPEPASDTAGRADGKHWLDGFAGIKVAEPASAPSEEPVAWMRAEANAFNGYGACHKDDHGAFPVYRHAPPRE